MYFGHKHVETGPNCSHELVTFPKYHMPLMYLYQKKVFWKKSFSMILRLKMIFPVV